MLFCREVVGPEGWKDTMPGAQKGPGRVTVCPTVGNWNGS